MIIDSRVQQIYDKKTYENDKIIQKKFTNFLLRREGSFGFCKVYTLRV